MNALDILAYGQQTVLGTIDGFPGEHWETPGACGVWSTKNILAHLTSYECVLVDVLSTFNGSGPTPYLDRFRQPGGRFNDSQVDQRAGQTTAETLAELQSVHTRVITLAGALPVETLRQTGTLLWYGSEYALDDLIVYAFYGHKREHSAQIALFRDHLKAS